MLSNIRSFFHNFKRYQAPLEKYVFPVVLLLYPLIGVNQGLDIADTTYSLSNYQYFWNVDPMWALSTFLGNFFGKLIMHLPGAGTMLGMTVYCSFIISIIALIPYFLMQKWMPGWMIFIGEFVAESLCWCPRVILYNYLTYLFMTLGVLLLVYGLFECEGQWIYLLTAGVCLGLNVMVRFPNVVEMGFILVLWFFVFITRQELFDAVKKTLICIGGYLLGILIPLIGISAFYGPSKYFEMIGSLFGMTEGASDYTAGGMISSIISAYLSAASGMLIMIPCIAAGIIMFCLFPEKYVTVKKILYILGLLILVKFFFSRGIFTTNYYYYDSVFKAAMMFVIITLILSVVGSAGILNGSRNEQTLAFLALMIILITPLGSNNYTYPVINNLFVMAPISLWLFRRLMQRLGDKHYNFAWQAMITMVLFSLVIQGVLFHAGFAFGDGDDGKIRDSHSSIKKVSAMVTNSENAESLDELYQVLEEEKILSGKAIFFGGVPGLSYIFDLDPAIDTVWPDLDSYSVEKFEDQLDRVSFENGAKPAVILGKATAEYANIDKKYDILLDYIAHHDYNKIFESNRFIVYASGNESEE